MLPHLIDRACGSAPLREWRDRAAEGLAGRVVEIGFGSGLNVAHYPPGVDVVLAVEPAEYARRLAAPRIEQSPVPVEHVGLDGQDLPLADASCDAALCTFTLCTIPDPAAALAELRRVVRPGGRLHLLEHGIAPDPGVQRWQRRLDPVQRRLADGCHLTRDPLALVRDAGFELAWSDQRYARGPRPWSWFTAGVAHNPGRRVVVVVAHPDDESFALGALIDHEVRAGATVEVLCLTRGEASTLGAGADLASVRARELTEAAAELGVTRTSLLDHPDGGLDAVDPGRLVEDVLAFVGSRPVSSFLVFDPDGVTGHPDHRAATRAALAAAGRLGVPVDGWTVPTDVAAALNAELGTAFTGHGAAGPGDAVVRVDRSAQRRAVERHRSQSSGNPVLWRRLELLGDREVVRRLPGIPPGV